MKFKLKENISLDNLRQKNLHGVKHDLVPCVKKPEIFFNLFYFYFAFTWQSY